MNSRSLFHTNGKIPPCPKYLSVYVNRQNNTYRSAEDAILIHWVLLHGVNLGVGACMNVYVCTYIFMKAETRGVHVKG